MGVMFRGRFEDFIRLKPSPGARFWGALKALSVGAKIRLQLSAQFSHALDMGLVSFLAY